MKGSSFLCRATLATGALAAAALLLPGAAHADGGRYHRDDRYEHGGDQRHHDGRYGDRHHDDGRYGDWQHDDGRYADDRRHHDDDGRVAITVEVPIETRPAAPPVAGYRPLHPRTPPRIGPPVRIDEPCDDRFAAAPPVPTKVSVWVPGYWDRHGRWVAGYWKTELRAVAPAPTPPRDATVVFWRNGGRPY